MVPPRGNRTRLKPERDHQVPYSKSTLYAIRSTRQPDKHPKHASHINAAQGGPERRHWGVRD